MADIDNTTYVTVKNNLTTCSERNVFWLDDINVLYKDKGYIQIVPVQNMTKIEQLNAITRFCLYVIILLFIFDRYDLLYLPLIGIIIIIIVYNMLDIDKMNNERMENINNKHMRNINNGLNYKRYPMDDDIDTIDKSGSILIDCDKNKDHDLISKIVNCGIPTNDKPFMNSSVTNFKIEHSPVAYNADDEDIKKDMELKFTQDMYLDIENVFNKKNYQRQFYTVAHSISNDMEAFARWCYKFPPTCKTNQERCLKYEDIRYKYYS